MKRKLVVLTLLITARTVYADDFAGHSFFTVRPQFRLVSPEKLTLYFPHDMEFADGGLESKIQVVAFGGMSTNSCQLNQYFLPSNKTSLNVQEYKTPDFTQDGQSSKDIEARNFNIVTQSADQTFRSNIAFKPQQSTFGIGLSWVQNIWHDCNGVPRFWGEISFPVQYVNNSMNLRETVLNDGGGVANVDGVPTTGLDGAPHVANMTEAFAQSSWLYGKVDNCADLSAWGVSDIEITFGYNVYLSESCDFNAYVGFVAPTGTKIDQKNAAYLWRPVIGNNHHWGVLFGAHTCFYLRDWGQHALRLEFDAEGQYLFKNTQWRSFDLVQQGQWSRYLEVYQNVAAATAAAGDASPLNLDAGTSGINLFTTCAQVSPKFSANTNTAFIYNYCGLQVEGGFNFFVRQAEEISKCSWNSDVAIKDIDGTGLTNIARSIKNNFTDSDIALANYNPLSLADLDLNSAAHPTMLSHTVFAAAGWNWDELRTPVFIGVGGSYEFTTVNTALDRWLIFGKVGISF
ncbi:MAG: hypothetical protein K2X90_03820 [Candidatus Babeliaceae bacterium]|nr:hypothetical protein [Candidatus Babeliaceae bacterium]